MTAERNPLIGLMVESGPQLLVGMPPAAPMRATQLATHPLRGALFETWVAAEIAKSYLHRGRRPHLSFYRDRRGLEIDLVLERGAGILLVEIKAAQTPSGQAFSAFERFGEALAGRQAPRIADRVVVYAGNETQQRSQGTILSWRDLDTYDWAGSP
jgi:predicted AAA+ superfamily ATPase